MELTTSSIWTKSKKRMLDVMEGGSKQEVNFQLSLLKMNGVIQFDRVLLIPAEERISAIASSYEGRSRISAAISASIKSALDNLNLRLGMNEDQIFDLAEEVIDQSFEDNLSLEDVLLFLKELLTGKAGKIFDRLDMTTFFELFEKYRQQRHIALLRIREEQHAQQKAFGPPERWSDMTRDEEKDAFHEAMKDYARTNGQISKG